MASVAQLNLARSHLLPSPHNLDPACTFHIAVVDPAFKTLSSPALRSNHRGWALKLTTLRRPAAIRGGLKSCVCHLGPDKLPTSRTDPGVKSAAVVDEAIIVGGGIGGLATAVALQKIGINVKVYERSSKEDRLQELGSMLNARGSIVADTFLCNTNGEVLSPSGVSSHLLQLQWSTIVSTLAESLPAGSIKSGYTCTNVVGVGGEVEVHVMKGGETTIDKAPLVIGADGIHSRVREFVLNDNLKVVVDLGRLGWRSMIPTPPSLELFTSPENVLERRLGEVQSLPTWSKGRVVLTGDVAHAMSPTMGQGANMALEDALEMARQLLGSRSLEEALGNFVAVRQARLKFVMDFNTTGTKVAYAAGEELAKGQYDTINNYARLSEPLIPL